jgi:two-component system, chemotaxis family, sensor kinase CheA
VGMDVVKKNVEALRGSVEIFTELNHGTTFTIRLPLTLAIIDGMIVRVNNGHYIVPTLSIIETIAAKDDLVDTVLGQGSMIKVRGNLLPLHHLSQILGLKWQKNAQAVALIVEDTLGKQAGIMVDEIIGQQQVVIKNIGSGIIDVPGISGGAIMSDGTVSLILDISAILKSANEVKHKEVA